MNWFDQRSKVWVRPEAGPWPSSIGKGFWRPPCPPVTVPAVPWLMQWMLLVMFSASTSSTHQQHPASAVEESLPTLSQHLSWVVWLPPSDPGGDHDWAKPTCGFNPLAVAIHSGNRLSQDQRNAKWLFLANLRSNRFLSLPQKLSLGTVGCQSQELKWSFCKN